MNVHDIVVLDRFRGQDISQLLLEKVAAVAKEKEACKLTLEVLEHNRSAQAAYAKFGFSGYELDPEFGHAVFLEKQLL